MCGPAEAVVVNPHVCGLCCIKPFMNLRENKKKTRRKSQSQLLWEIAAGTQCSAEGQQDRRASHGSGVIPASSTGRTPEQTRPEAEPHCTSTFLCAEAITEVLKLSLFLLCLHLNFQTETLYVTKTFTAINKLCGLPALPALSQHWNLQFGQFLKDSSLNSECQGGVILENVGRRITTASHWVDSTSLSFMKICLFFFFLVSSFQPGSRCRQQWEVKVK